MRRERAPLCLLVVLQLCPAQVPSRSPVCPSGAYTATGACCSLCPPGFGTAEPCGAADTRSEPCGHARSLSAPPQPCGAAGCAGSPARRRPRSAELRVLKRSGAAPNASAAGEPEPEPPEGAGKNIIPVYCSILAAVVVGLLAYVAFKCWHGCKQKQQLAKARAGELGTAPDGEKLHGDSGVFLDTHSLQEPHGKAPPRAEGGPLGALAPSRREELERLLESGGEWRALAARLGYDAAAVGAFGRGQAPARTLLAAWAAADGASVDALARALVSIGRPDAAERLAAPPDASSLV